ncbi:MAG TPA: hypothetical protein PLV64_13015 [Anaerolineales bacterium]|nr:hypothetical protein [Anaerolineales bacterium]
MPYRVLLITWWVAMMLLGACQVTQSTSSPTLTVSPIDIGTNATEVFDASPSFTPVPTLSEENAYLLLTDLLNTNNDCQLPCWWGITPSQSDPLVLHNTLTPLGSIADTRLLFANSGSVEILYPKNDWVLNIVMSFEADETNELVKLIIVRAKVFPAKENVDSQDRYSAAEYHELIKMYSLSKILSVYGMPSQVLIRADIYNYTQSPDTFETTLLYPEKGIFVRYNSLAERVGDKVYGCPSKAFVELWLLSPGDGDSYQTILSAKDMTWEENFPYSKSVEEATLMSLEEFYRVFSKPTDNCLETPLNIWPEH